MKLQAWVYGVFLTLLFPCLLMGQEIKSSMDNLETIFKSLRPAERKSLIEGYEAVMNSASLTGTEKQEIDSLFLELLKLKVTVHPELKDFVLCVNRLGMKENKSNLNVWLKGMQRTMAVQERKRSEIRNYLEKTVELATEQVVFNGNAHRWVVRGEVAWSDGKPIRVDFKDVDLICSTPKDSIRIYGTSGYYLLDNDYLCGAGGRVEWNNQEQEMNAELNHYRINLKMSGYIADSVRFNYPAKFDRPLIGQIKDNALKYEQGKDKAFPEFTSYATNIRINDLFPDISYCGGITYTGLKFTGTGTDEHPAYLQIVPNDTIYLKVYAKRFLLDSVRILSGKAALEIGMDSGRITHPDINFSYAAPDRQVAIKRITEQSLHTPFKDTYHGVLLGMEEIYWALDSNFMEMKMSSRSGLFKAIIESLNFFSDDVYDQLQGLDEINPLNGLLKCSLAESSEVFTLKDYAAFMKKPVDQLRKQVILLSYNDFVDYNEIRDEVTLKQRLYDYTKARVGKQDYDNIRFISHPKDSRVNARLDVHNFNLDIRGVEKFLISDARNIFVVPADGRVVMMKNRDMAFNGKLNAGMFDMYGQNLFFSYDQYKIELPKVDSASMYLAGKNKNLRGDKIKSLIRDISGEIVIDKSNNKSGKKEDPGFPRLNSTKESYVYFDDPAIQQGQYKREQFYYVINPYSINGINDAGKFRYAFDGTLMSGIVSPIRDTLRLMEDNALGLTYKIPATGLDLYGKGKIYHQITLNRSGFMANGTVDLNHSHFQADTILMLPGRMQAKTPEIRINALKSQRPEAFGKDVSIQYLSEAGNLQVTSTTQPLEIYAERVKHHGTVFVYENALDADGKLELEDATLNSKLFHLQPENILADRTALQLSAISNKEIQLNTSDVKAEIDLLANKGRFVNNTRTNQATFSSSRYTCSFESFTWYMKEAFLNIGVEDNQQLLAFKSVEADELLPSAARNIFVSTDPQTDSLRFIAPLAHYDLKTGNIEGEAVNHIDIANGRFYPADGKVAVQAGGNIQPFSGGELLCERTDSTKCLQNVDLKLKGRHSFSGSGNYTYVSEEQDKSILHFAELGVDTLGFIYAKAVLKEEQPLLLNDGFHFKGDLVLQSRQKNLFFDGFVEMTTEKSFLKHTWMAVRQPLEAQHVLIPTQVENRDDCKQRVFNGIYLATDKTFRPYAAFMSNRLFYNDDLLIGGQGGLKWFAPLKQYIIEDTLSNKYYRFRYDPETEIISAFGKLNLNSGLSGIYQQAAGDISYNLKEEQLLMNDILYLMDFSLLPKMENVLLKDFADKKLKMIQTDKSRSQKIYEVFGKEVMQDIDKQLKRPMGNVPDSLNQLFVLDSLDFTWNPKTHSYIADGNAIVVAMRGKAIEKPMNIKMELLRGRSGNQFFMYIYNDQVWYYFEYADKSIYTLSSDTEYNEILKLEKADKKVVRNAVKEELYTITLCPDSKKNRFLERVK